MFTRSLHRSRPAFCRRYLFCSSSVNSRCNLSPGYAWRERRSHPPVLKERSSQWVKRSQRSVPFSTSVNSDDDSNDALSMRNLLSSEQKRMIHQIQDAVDEITETLTHLDIDKQDRRMLRRAIYQLNELFLFVVVGEFNSGKSMFINSIVGSTQCETGVLPTTDHLHILKYGDTEQHSVEEDDIHVSHLPVELLKEANIVDTPGTNAILRHHQAITEHFVPRSDIICFVTSVDRPFSESERQFLQRIYAWKKKVVLVLNKIDTLSQHDRLDDLHKIEAFVRENGRQVLNEDPVVFGVSSLSAFQAKQGYAQAEEEGDEEKKEEYQRMLHDSGFPALQQYLLETIAGGNRMRLKFESPIGVAEQLLFKYSQALEDRRRVIQDDASVLELFDSDMATFKTDMIADFEYQQNKLENVFLKMKRNADEFFQENLTLSQLPQLILHRHRLKEAFDQKVNEDVNEDVQECVNTLIDWLINRSNRQFASAVRHISRTSIARRNQSQHRSYESGRGHRDNGDSDGDGDGDHDQFDALLAGSRAYSNASSNVNDHSDHSNASGSRHSRKLDLRHSLATDSIDLNVNFYTRRSSLLEGFDSHTKSLLTATDRQKQCNDIDEKIRSAVLQLSAIEMTSLGLGALFSTALFDWTGIAGALSLSVGGLYLLPYKRQQLQADMRVTIDTMQHRMLKLTRRHFEKELESNIRMIHDRLDPYSKFVRMESERVQELDTRLKTSVKKLSQLRRKIREITTQAKSGEKGD